ncbi:MAG: ATP-binding protein [Bacteroidia bacterium]
MNIILQSILSYGASFVMVIYIPYYFYKAYGLTKLKFHAYWGSFIFLLGPYIACFAIPYVLTGNLEASVRASMVVPFFYALVLLYNLNKAIKAKNLENPDVDSKKELSRMFLGVMPFVLLPIMAFFKNELDRLLIPVLHFKDGSQVVEVLITNLSLLIFTILFIKSTVKQSQAEYLELLQSQSALQKLNSELLESEKELQNLNAELMVKVKERTRELELANEKRTNAFVNLAHETKTPLMLISNYLDDYIKKYGQHESKELKLLRKSIGNLTKDIVNFFDMEKIQKGIDLYNHNHIADFKEIVGDSIPLFDLIAGKKRITIESNVSDEIFVKADPSALTRIVNNLLENAIKYTPEGGLVKVSLTTVNDKVYLSVNDNGIGIPPAFQNIIFEPYRQIDSEKGNFQGMGLGLPIVSKLICDLNGKITIVSDPLENPGTRVLVELPVYKKTKEEFVMNFSDNTRTSYEVEFLNIPEQVFDGSKYTILIVEDKIDLLSNMVCHLQPKFNIHFASNGNEAIEKLKGITQLDLIVSDVMMDNGDGHFLFEYLKTHIRFTHVPLIFLTARNSVDERMKGFESGAVDYICKPVSFVELEARINAFLKSILNHKNAFIKNALTFSENPAMGISILNRVGTEQLQERACPIEVNCIKYSLTPREAKIVGLLADGKVAKEIASVLFITEDTTRKHIQNVYRKVGVSSKFDLLKKMQA